MVAAIIKKIIFANIVNVIRLGSQNKYDIDPAFVIDKYLF